MEILSRLCVQRGMCANLSLILRGKFATDIYTRMGESNTSVPITGILKKIVSSSYNGDYVAIVENMIHAYALRAKSHAASRYQSVFGFSNESSVDFLADVSNS